MSTLTAREANSQSRAAKWGWGILLVVAALIILQGVGAYITSVRPDLLGQFVGASMSELRQSYPAAADALVLQMANFAILAFAFGLLALVVALKGLRHGSRWAWNAYWVVTGSLAVIVVNTAVQGGGLDFIGLFLLALALAGQVLASRGFSAQDRDAG